MPSLNGRSIDLFRADLSSSADANGLVEVEYHYAVVVDLGFDKRFGAGDGDAVLAAELCRRHIIGTELLFDQWHDSRASWVGGLNGDLVQCGFVVERDRLRTTEVYVGMASDMYLPVMINCDVVPVKPALLLDPVELQPVSMQ